MSKQMNLLMENWRRFLKEDISPDSATAQQLDNIIKLPYKEFVTQFGKIASDPKVQAVLKYGLEDGKPDDEKVKITNMTPYVYSLKPTQNEIDMNGSLKWALKSVKSFENLVSDGVKTLGSPIVTAAGGTLVIDGHHRWSQLYCMNPNGQINAIDLNIEGATAETYLKIMQLAIAADIEKVPTQSVKGTNLLDNSLTDLQLEQWIAKNADRGLLDSVGTSKGKLNLFVKDLIAKFDNNIDMQNVNEKLSYGEKMRKQSKQLTTNAGLGAKLLTKYIWPNILKMRETSQPVDPKPKRDFMPQTDDAKNWMAKVTSGEINFKDTAKIAASAAVAPAIQKESLKKIVRQVIRENLKRK